MLQRPVWKGMESRSSHSEGTAVILMGFRAAASIFCLALLLQVSACPWHSLHMMFLQGGEAKPLGWQGTETPAVPGRGRMTLKRGFLLSLTPELQVCMGHCSFRPVWTAETVEFRREAAAGSPVRDTGNAVCSPCWKTWRTWEQKGRQTDASAAEGKRTGLPSPAPAGMELCMRKKKAHLPCCGCSSGPHGSPYWYMRPGMRTRSRPSSGIFRSPRRDA